MSINNKGTEIDKLPKCSFCKKDALYDMKMARGGYWAYLCENHKYYGIKLGTGYGQKLILKIE